MSTCLMLIAMSVLSLDIEPSILPDDNACQALLAGDSEEEIINSFRLHDKQQQALAENEMGRSQTLAMEGKRDEALAEIAKARKRLDNIRKCYEKLMLKYPKNARVHNYFGELMYDRFGEEGIGLSEWQKATKLDPGLPYPWNNMAIHACHVGEYQKGFEYYETALKLDPENPDFLFNIAQAYLVHPQPAQDRHGWDRKKVYEEAMKMSEKAAEKLPADLEIAKDYAMNFFAGKNFGVDVNWPDAAQAWQKVRALSKTDDQIFLGWLNEARVWVRAEKDRKAKKCLTEALKIRPASSAAQALLKKVEEEG